MPEQPKLIGGLPPLTPHMPDKRKTFHGETPKTSDCVLCHYCGDLLHAPEEDVFWEQTVNHSCPPMLKAQIDELEGGQILNRNAILRKQAKIEKLEAALKWYDTHVSDCRKLGHEGDVARAKLDRDGGNKAREALKVVP
jgi:hypothetical protein